MAIGRLIERLFVQVRADLSQLSGQLQMGVRQTQTATQSMARQWTVVSSSIEALEADLQRGLITQGQYMAQMNRHAAQVAVLSGSYREAQRQVFRYAASLRQAATVQQVAMNPVPIRRFGRSAGMARMQMQNLGFQLNDIGMTLATGMNPMTVMIQQGSQIVQIYGGQGGINALFRDLGRIFRALVLRLWPVALVVGAVTTAFAVLTREINKTTDVGVTMGDTFKAVFQVLHRRIMALLEGPLASLQVAWERLADWLARVFPPVMNAIVLATVVGVRVMAATWELLPDLWHDTWIAMKNITINTIQAIVNFITQDFIGTTVSNLQLLVNQFEFAFSAITIIWLRFPDVMRDAIAGAVNAVVGGLEAMINSSIMSINRLIFSLNQVMEFVGADQALQLFGFEGALEPIPMQDLDQWRIETQDALSTTGEEIAAAAGRIFQQTWLEEALGIEATDLSQHLGEFRDAFGQLGERIDQILGEEVGTDFLGDFFDDVRLQAIQNALGRIADETEEIGEEAEESVNKLKVLIEELMGQMNRAADNLARVFGNAFERLARTGRLTFGDFVRDLNNLIIRSTSEILQQELANMFKQFALSRGGLGGTFANLFTSIFGGGVPGKQGGGIAMPFQSFFAGEQGTELITQDGPSGARRIMTAGRTRNMMQNMGGSPISIAFNITTPDVEGFRRSQSQLAGRAQRFISQAQRNQ